MKTIYFYEISCFLPFPSFLYIVKFCVKISYNKMIQIFKENTRVNSKKNDNKQKTKKKGNVAWIETTLFYI